MGYSTTLYRLKPETRTCLGQELDMSGENCLGNSGNFRNHPKTQYSTEFGVGPIEYIYISMCMWYMDKL
jgi:hypothetical protein